MPADSHYGNPNRRHQHPAKKRHQLAPRCGRHGDHCEGDGSYEGDVPRGERIRQSIVDFKVGARDPHLQQLSDPVGPNEQDKHAHQQRETALHHDTGNKKNRDRGEHLR